MLYAEYIIMIYAASNVPMLCDFEVSRQAGTLATTTVTHSHPIGGTLQFLAPELCDPATGLRIASKVATFKSDAFALGRKLLNRFNLEYYGIVRLGWNIMASLDTKLSPL